MQSPYRLLSALVALSFSSVTSTPALALKQVPPLILAASYHDHIDLSRYWVVRNMMAQEPGGMAKSL